MLDTIKFQKKLTCVCKNIVLFEIISEIECDWGCHTVIQCPRCEELFSIDKKCPAFETIEKLWKKMLNCIQTMSSFLIYQNLIIHKNFIILTK